MISYKVTLIKVHQNSNETFDSDRRTTRGLLATDHVILNHGQVTWTTSELAPPLLTTTLHQREDVSALDRFNVHRCPTRWVFSGTGLELVMRQVTIRYQYHSVTEAISQDGTKVSVNYGFQWRNVHPRIAGAPKPDVVVLQSFVRSGLGLKARLCNKALIFSVTPLMVPPFNR
ncbi:uncharacterized protein TNCV_1436251 [Trichonephila clavipes]|nr:uncharacterized protein TNCV_1436251 [Trichonephila clavipes]